MTGSKPNQRLDREAVRQQHCLGHAIGTPGDQFEGASARGGRAALAASWHRSLGMSLVYFCSEHIEDDEASRGARVWWLLAHDINSELHVLAVDVQRCDRSAFRGPIKVVRECSS